MTDLKKIFSEMHGDVECVLAGGEVSDPLFQALFDYFCGSGDIPYGAATASDEDPYEWIETKVREIGRSLWI